jgi:hypothetical protein
MYLRPMSSLISNLFISPEGNPVLGECALDCLVRRDTGGIMYIIAVCTDNSCYVKLPDNYVIVGDIFPGQ